MKFRLDIVETIRKSGANFISINEKIDSSSPSGRLMFHVFGVIAEFECERIRERVLEGISAARAKGRVGGKSSALSLEQKQTVIEARTIQRKSISDCACIFGVSRRTISRVLANSFNSFNT